MFLRTTAINKLLKLKKRIKVIPGGTSAGKTFGVLPILIDKATRNPGVEISVVSESIPHLRKGALKDFLKIMKETGRYIDENYNRTLLQYTFSNGAYIEFFSADQEDKVRGPRRNILYINEANNLKFETYHQLAIRTDQEIWIDYNPSNSFWADTELKSDSDAEWLTLTYKDNEALADSIIKEIEKALTKGFYIPDLPADQLFEAANIKNSYWSNWWKVYGLGMTGSLEGVIFDWKTVKEIPKEAVLIAYGLDWGFTNDPTALVGVYRHNQNIYLDELIYERGLTNDAIASRMRSLGIKPTDIIIADSAEPKSIQEIHNYGFNIQPAQKGPDSIKNSIDVLQRFTVFVTERSTNVIKEQRSYCWDKDKDGNTINKPVDYLNHSIDGVRYVALNKLANLNSGRYEIL